MLILNKLIPVGNTDTVQKMKFSINNFFSKFDQIHSFLRFWSHLLKKSLIENFIFCPVGTICILQICITKIQLILLREIDRIDQAGIYLLKANNRNTRTRCEICSKLTIKLPEQRQWPITLLLTLNMFHTMF